MSDPLTLAFDTSAAQCAAALLSGDRLLDARAEDMAKGQAERLMGLLEEMLSAQGAEFGDVSVIGVGTGPGNFTGIRLSVAAARGLALSTGARAIGVTRLEAALHGLPRPAVACFDARRGAVYLQAFAAGRADPPRLVTEGELATLDLPAGAVCVGDAAGAAAAACGGSVADPAEPLAVAIARFAHARRAGPAERPAPLYLRAADAAPAAPAPQLIP
ncbi:MAG: tRNA (adenosine(37)-N6)-threonylcarbamoyltransferase complex dimerization subunit type 1 TsaB [Rhodobacteraceae bacterium]|nr:tRNA (adenosine(37)-N6)-threonylcarbamoyltransferase complex dimerization subunit type 1 TsaB [Paracoccaceae bacterium]